MTKLKHRKPSSAAMIHPLVMVTFMFGLFIAPTQASAQQPGTGAVVSLRLSQSAEPIQGWSVKHGLLGRPVYASIEGKQTGTVLDLVVTPAAAPFVLIIGAAGALEIGGHAVAVPIADVMEQGGVLILPSATRGSLKAMPRFTYSKAAIHRAEYIRATSAQLAEANALLLTRQKRASADTGAIGTELALDNIALQSACISLQPLLTALRYVRSHSPELAALCARYLLIEQHASQAECVDDHRPTVCIQRPRRCLVCCMAMLA